MSRFLLVSCLTLALALTLSAADWPQFRGPARDGVSKETGLLPQWPAGGPKLLATYEGCGVGYSGPAVVGDRLFLAGGRGDDEVLFALDLKGLGEGKVTELWAAKIGPLFTWKGNQWNAGPNATPTVDGGRVYAVGGFGDVLCADAATGKEVWRVSLPRDLGGAVDPIGGGLKEPTHLGWGYAAAPLVDGDKLIVVPGGAKGLFAALDKATGRVLWRSAEVTDEASYSSPVVAEIGGVRQYVAATNKGLVGVAAADGTRVWAYTRSPAYDDVVISTPVVRGDLVYASVGFNEGFNLVKVGPNGAVAKVAAGRDVQNRDGGMVLVGDHLYGHSEQGGWVCQEFATGKVVWAERDALGRGTITAADGRLYCCAEKGGVLALVEPSPAGWGEKGRLKLPRESRQRRPSGGLWTAPVVANGRLYVRDQEQLFAYDVRK